MTELCPMEDPSWSELLMSCIDTVSVAENIWPVGALKLICLILAVVVVLVPQLYP